MLSFARRGLIFIIFSFLCLGCNQAPSPFFQKEIKGLRLVRVITGEDALFAINKLHGKEIKVESATIAFYQGEKEKATIWVSESACEGDAIQQTADMIRKMTGNKKSPFSDYQEMERKGVKVYSFMGMGQQHYIFRIKEMVYWISANPGTIDAVRESISSYSTS